MENQSLWQIVKGTLSGADQQGSAKRATAFFVVSILITSITVVYTIGFFMAINKMCSQEICLTIINLFTEVLTLFIIFVLVLLGLATMENITNLLPWKRDKNTEQPKK